MRWIRGTDDLVDGAYVKRLRQRERNGTKCTYRSVVLQVRQPELTIFHFCSVIGIPEWLSVSIVRLPPWFASLGIRTIKWNWVLCAEDPAEAKEQLDLMVNAVPVAPFDTAAATAYGSIRLATKDRKEDLGVTLVNNNVDNSRVYPNVKIENWVEAKE